MYTLQFLGKAVEDLKRIDFPFQRIIKKNSSFWLRTPTSSEQHHQLSGADEEYYRLRVGNYRIIFEKKERELLILVVRIGHRREVYR